ncbi:hypothetical protein E1264_08320 [Actinomadura sp. KC216]|uniref:hypothetical protein n=1 Tax=Actinomadura sp. KC216 TaxID=2530370 RepID=UPI001050B0A8|nr:hypothetical protein [Actinomadura sp. KC216]TDB89409.1 hypothetical protein E1264_08320 [Actinomadura sp. KC216]
MTANRLIRSLSVTATAFALMVITTAPAQAVPNLQRISATTVSDSSTTKSVTAACPAGTSVLGGGGEIINGAGEVVFTGLRPTSTLSGYQVGAHEDETGYSGNWKIRAHAVCGSAPAGAEHVASTGPGSTGVTYTSVFCPSGKHIIGMGGQINNGQGQVMLLGSNPFDPAEVLTPAVPDDTGYTGTWTITSVAVCANPIQGRTVVFGSSANDSTTPKSATATCPAGTRVHAGSSSIGGFPDTNSLIRERVVPNTALTSVTATGRETPGAGSPDPWSVTAYAICAP